MIFIIKSYDSKNVKILMYTCVLYIRFLIRYVVNYLSFHIFLFLVTSFSEWLYLNLQIPLMKESLRKWRLLKFKNVYLFFKMYLSYTRLNETNYYSTVRMMFWNIYDSLTKTQCKWNLQSGVNLNRFKFTILRCSPNEYNRRIIIISSKKTIKN